jgi:hypothetical protein
MTRVVAALCVLAIALAIPVPAATTQTSILIFSPWSSGGLQNGFSVAKKAKGYCWTQSLTRDRPDAWRCFIGNDIYDPCFAGQRRPTVGVACAEDPFSKRVVLLTLTKPLPHNVNPTTRWLQPKGEPWGLRLANGDTCFFATGATDVAAGMRMNYECNGNGWIVGFPDRTKPLWTAHAIVWPNKSRLKRVEIAAAVF